MLCCVISCKGYNTLVLDHSIYPLLGQELGVLVFGLMSVDDKKYKIKIKISLFEQSNNSEVLVLGLLLSVDNQNKKK